MSRDNISVNFLRNDGVFSARYKKTKGPKQFTKVTVLATSAWSGPMTSRTCFRRVLHDSKSVECCHGMSRASCRMDKVKRCGNKVDGG